MSKIEIELIKLDPEKLDPDAVYVLTVDPRSVSGQTIDLLLKELEALGVKRVVGVALVGGSDGIKFTKVKGKKK